MSGTSADAVDAALVAWPDTAAVRPFELLAHLEVPLEPALQARIHALAAGRVPAPDALRELTSLDVALGEAFAEAALAVIRLAGLEISGVAAVASHGQTVAHHPEVRATLQIGDPSVIAERTGLTTVADFRARDMAAGGEAAPLAPFFHHAVFAGHDADCLVVNLGGMANVTWLPRGGDPEAVRAFDTGPANALIDGVIFRASDGRQRMDLGGARAAQGKVDEALLAELLDDDYLRRPPPKSTGRERYGLAEAEALLEGSRSVGRGLDDLLATLVAFTAESVALGVRRFLGPPDRVLAGGGGVHNPVLRAALAARLGAAVEPFDVAGVPAGAAEAMAFSLMGRNTLLGLPNHLPRCTGAARACVLGEVVPGRSDPALPGRLAPVGRASLPSALKR